MPNRTLNTPAVNPARLCTAMRHIWEASPVNRPPYVVELVRGQVYLRRSDGVRIGTTVTTSVEMIDLANARIPVALEHGLRQVGSLLGVRDVATYTIHRAFSGHIRVVTDTGVEAIFTEHRGVQVGKLGQQRR